MLKESWSRDQVTQRAYLRKIGHLVGANQMIENTIGNAI